MNTKILSGSMIRYSALLALAIVLLGAPPIYARQVDGTAGPERQPETTILYIGADNKVKSLSYEDMSKMKLGALKQLLQEAAQRTIPKDPSWRQKANERLDNAIKRIKMEEENLEIIDSAIPILMRQPLSDVVPLIVQQQENLAAKARMQGQVLALREAKAFIANFGKSSPIAGQERPSKAGKESSWLYRGMDY